MKVTKKDYQAETSNKKRLFYHCPLARKKQRVSAQPAENGKVKHFTSEELWLENLRRLKWKGEFS